jgi:predicted DNA-binding transcriptional regulator YafY
VKFSVGSLDEVLSFRPFAPGDADVCAFEALSAGIRNRQQVSFLYRNHGSLVTRQRNVCPYHLAHVHGQWYLFGLDLARKARRTFVLCRLSQPRLLKTSFEMPEKFDLNTYLRESFTVYHGKDGDDYEVVVDLDAWGADEVRGRRWHASQQLTELPKGMLRVSLRLNNLEEVEKWVMGLGVHATVVRPLALRERLRKAATELVQRYREDEA